MIKALIVLGLYAVLIGLSGCMGVSPEAQAKLDHMSNQITTLAERNVEIKNDMAKALDDLKDNKLDPKAYEQLAKGLKDAWEMNQAEIRDLKADKDDLEQSGIPSWLIWLILGKDAALFALRGKPSKGPLARLDAAWGSRPPAAA